LIKKKQQEINSAAIDDAAVLNGICSYNCVFCIIKSSCLFVAIKMQSTYKTYTHDLPFCLPPLLLLLAIEDAGRRRKRRKEEEKMATKTNL